MNFEYVMILIFIPVVLIWLLSIFVVSLLFDYKNKKFYLKEFIDKFMYVLKMGSYKNYKKELQRIRLNKVKNLTSDNFKPIKKKNIIFDFLYLFLLLISVLYFSNFLFQTNTSQSLSVIISDTNNYSFLKKLKPRNVIIIKNNVQIYNSLEYKYQKFDEYRYKNVIIKQYYPSMKSIKEIYIYIINSFKNFKNNFVNLNGKEFLLKYELNFVILIVVGLVIFYIIFNEKISEQEKEEIYKFILNLENERNKQIELNERLQMEKQQLEKNQNLIFDKLSKYQNKLTFKLELLKYQLENNLIESSIMINLRVTLENFLKNQVKREFIEFPYFNNSKKLVDLINIQKEKGISQKIITYMHNIRMLGNFTAHENQQIEKYQVIAYLQFLLEIFEYYEIPQNNLN